MRAAGASAKRRVQNRRSFVITNDYANKADDVRRQASAARIAAFRSTVWEHWKENGRHDLPWRRTRDPYKILVSEVMLQQTQVPRVIEKYESFLKEFPTARARARAPLRDVLKAWSGLGYNRRGKYLHDAAKIIVKKFRGRVPTACSELAELPGIGAYTASAVRAFAYNLPDILIETNIRAVYIHHFSKIWTRRVHISDEHIAPIAHEAAKGQDPREWHWALMDYGVHIKKLHQNPSRRSAHYCVQTKFEGSLRQVRGAILKLLVEGSHGDLAIAKKLSFDASRTHAALAGLARDGLVAPEKGSWRIA